MGEEGETLGLFVLPLSKHFICFLEGHILRAARRRDE